MSLFIFLKITWSQLLPVSLSVLLPFWRRSLWLLHGSVIPKSAHIWKIPIKQWPGRGKEESSIHHQTWFSRSSPLPHTQMPLWPSSLPPCLCTEQQKRSCSTPIWGEKKGGAACSGGSGEGVTGERNELVLREPWRPDWRVSFILFQFSKSLN